MLILNLLVCSGKDKYKEYNQERTVELLVTFSATYMVELLVSFGATYIRRLRLCRREAKDRWMSSANTAVNPSSAEIDQRRLNREEGSSRTVADIEKRLLDEIRAEVEAHSNDENGEEHVVEIASVEGMIVLGLRTEDEDGMEDPETIADANSAIALTFSLKLALIK